MKTPILKPGFEFIFTLSLIVILGLPPMLMAQNPKDVEIKIENGDTTVNGKNIKDLSAADRKNALRDIKHISSDGKAGVDGTRNRVLVFKRRDSTGHNPMITENITIKKDSMGNVVEMRSGRRLRRNNMPMRRQSADDRMLMMERNNNDPMISAEGRNVQSFHYINTDNDGISTHLSFHVSDVSNDDLKRMPHIEGPRLSITDLNIVPEFAAGKILLMFGLQTKTVAEVRLVDSDGKIFWSEKALGGNFSKAFVMGLNGIYYLQVKQGNGIAVKRILKDE